jgi:hypothetical protein
MRVFCFALALAVMAIPLSSSHADENEDLRKAVTAKAEEFKRKLLAKFDLNRDGQVDNIEKSQVAEQIQKDIANGKLPEDLKTILDLNGDGQVDPREMGMAREMMMRFQGQRGDQPQFGAPGAGGLGGFGGNGLGFGGQIPPDVMKKYDKNKDGQLDEKEQKAAMAAMGPKKSRAQQLKEKMDLDGDGKISKDEREAYAEQRKAEQEEKKREKAKKKDDDDR